MTGRRGKLTIAGLTAGLMLLVGAGSVAGAQSFRTGNDATVAAGDTVDGTLYISGSNIDVAGRVNGDVICAGQNVTVTGQVDGDVICAGQTVRVAGDVSGDVRLAGQTVTLGGNVDGRASLAAQTINSEAGSRIGGDAGLLGQRGALNGAVGRDLAFRGSELTVNGAVGRDIQATAARELHLSRQARVDGRINYASQRDLQRDNGASVTGDIDRRELDTAPSRSGGAWFGGLILYGLAALLVISMVLVLLMPRSFHAATDQALLAPGRTLLTGLVASLVVPALIGVLMFTLIGLPLGLVVLLGWLLALTLSGPVTAYLLGRLILRNNRNAILIMLTGSVVLLALYLIPVVNLLAVLAVVWFGLGSLIQAAPRPRRPGYEVTPTSQTLAKPRKGRAA